jgi:flagellin
MSRINTNMQSLIARRVFDANNALVNRTLTRLSTGLRINTGKDDPSGLIASETLRSQKVAIQAATDNARRADTLLAVAEGGLQEGNSLLLELEDLVDRSASTGGLSSDETKANQLQIDSILQSINQVSSLRGRIGAFQKNTLGSSINSLLVTLENTAAAESAIRDADFAVEASNLTRGQILASSSTSVLPLANIQPQNVLALLG